MQDFDAGGAFVLGGSGGLGSAISTAFARAGVPVALSYNSDKAAGETVVFLSSRRGGFITGVNLTADGGKSL